MEAPKHHWLLLSEARQEAHKYFFSIHQVDESMLHALYDAAIPVRGKELGEIANKPLQKLITAHAIKADLFLNQIILTAKRHSANADPRLQFANKYNQLSERMFFGVQVDWTATKQYLADNCEPKRGLQTKGKKRGRKAGDGSINDDDALKEMEKLLKTKAVKSIHAAAVSVVGSGLAEGNSDEATITRLAKKFGKEKLILNKAQ
jgi:hypothetical protein